MYQRPYNIDEIKKYYPDKAEMLLKDPVHLWRAQTGIELIHQEPTKEEQERIWNNWNEMTDEMKKKSDEKSLELFGKDNASHHDEIMKDDLPQIIKDVGFDFDWSEEKVWQLDVPVEDMPLQELEWHFDIPFLWINGGMYNLKPRQVIDNPEKYKEEYERTMKSDLKYPIDLMQNKGRWLILDGLHRLMKAKIQGLDIVKVRKISRDEIPRILK